MLFNISIKGFTLLMEDYLLLARQFYLNQDYANAQSYFEKYLTDAVYHRHLAEQVIEASLSMVGFNERVTFVSRYLSKMPTLQQRSQLYAYLAQLLEADQRYAEAISYYIRAYDTSRPLNDSFYYRAAMLSLEVGEYQRSVYMARLLWQRSITITLKNDVLALWLKALSLGSQYSLLKELLEQEGQFIDSQGQPNLLYTAYQAYLLLDDNQAAEKLRAWLTSRYPNSLETLLIANKIKRITTPSLLWG